MYKAIVIGGVVLGSVILGGCDAPVTPAKSAAASGSAESKPADLSELKSFVREQAGGGATPPSGAGNVLPSGHPPVGASRGSPAPSAEGAASAADLKYTAPTTWQTQQPRSGMRKAQFLLPRAEGDSEDGEMILFYFGRNEGGGVADNIARWRGMFTTAEGKPVGDEAVKQEKLEANGLAITLLEIAGRYAPSAMPGAPATGPKDDYRMLAAVIETPSGPWFFRGTGPRATMESHLPAFREMLRSVKP